MKVGELREAMEGLGDEAEVKLIEEGYRHTAYLDTDEAEVIRDDRTHDDYGHEKEALGRVLAIKFTGGNAGDNRYPPGDDDEEED